MVATGIKEDGNWNKQGGRVTLMWPHGTLMKFSWT